MPGGRGGRQRVHSVGSGLVLALLSSAFVYAAATADGNRATQLELHDYGIWLSKEDAQSVGRLNAALELVDARLQTAQREFELEQFGADVLLRSGDVLQAVDVTVPKLRPATNLPAGAAVGLGGATAAVLDPASGEVWTGSGTVIGTQKYEEDSPLVVEGADDLVVSAERTGTVFVIDHEIGQVTEVGPDGDLATRLEAEPFSATATMTTVGGVPVVLDGARLVTPSGETELPGGDQARVLQQPGPQNDSVLVAADTGLIAVPLSGGKPAQVFDGGGRGPVAPVFVAGCAYGAWSAPVMIVQDCGDGDPLSGAPEEVVAGSSLRFRVNRNQVALNVLTDGGSVLVVDGQLKYVNDWSQALQEAETEKDESEDEAETTEQLPECKADVNEAPVASPNDVTTRQGQPIVIRAVDDDDDANCDVLTAVLAEPLPTDVGVAQLVDGGRAVQFSPAAGFLGQVTIPYSASDGQLSTPSTITVLVQPADGEGSAPIARTDTTSVNEGRVITHNVLVNDFDPDGDALALLDVGEPDRGGRVRFRPDGQVVYTAPAAGSGVTGEVKVTYTVVDAIGLEAEGTLSIDVKPAEFESSPIARDDFARLYVGETVTINVLANDSDANGDSLSLNNLTPKGETGGSAVPEPSGDVTFTADVAGSFQYEYDVGDGTSSPPGKGRLRFDVRVREGTNPPIAVRDDVVLVPGRPTVVDVLANDTDLDGDVLVIQSVSDVPPNLLVEVIDRGLLQLTADAAGDVQVLTFRYTISDGPSADTGLVVVRTVPAGGENQPPVLAEDNAQVHAGGVATIPVLSNDYDPDGDVIVLEEASVREPAGTGVFVIQGDVLRYFAPPDFDGTVTGKYSVFDGVNRVSQTVRIKVKPITDNSPPEPPDLVARTFTGRRVTIPIPITSMDPDGDPVELLGIGTDPDTLPRLGQIVEVSADEIVYEPFDDPRLVGTDTFTYRVRDPFGSEGVGVIKVGVTSAATTNAPPVAVDDTLQVSPGKQIRIEPLLNDSDPDGDAIFLVEDGFVEPAAGTVQIDGNDVVFEAPPTESTFTMSYRVIDARQAESDFADIEVVVSAAALNRPPVAVDDAAPAQSPGTAVTVDVLENDVDPDGDKRLLLVSLPIPVEGVTVMPDQTISFAMPERALTVAYTITDPTDATLQSTAFVRVPLATNRPPLVVRQGVVETGYNANVSVDLMAGVSDPDGDDVSVVHTSFVAMNGSGAVTLDGTTGVFDPDDRFSGQGGFSYLVTDGTLSTIAFVLVSVEASGNVTPVFDTLPLEVPADSETTIALDTPEIVVDPDDDTHTFGDLDTSGLPPGVSAELSGDGTLTLRSTDPKGKGQSGQISFTVDDERENGIATGTVTVTVTGSDAAPPSARPDELEVKQNEAPSIDVLVNDVDPFEAEKGDRQLTIVTAGPVSPAAAGTMTLNADGQRIEFHPSGEYDGTATIPYTIQDRTADPDRQSSSQVTLTIKGEPGAPGVPAVTPENRQVTMFWEPADPNGDPLIGYEVVDQNGTVRCPLTSTPSSSCTATGLTNGEIYQFRVRAKNSVDWGPYSEPLSASAMPDTRPGTPDAPTTQFGDKQITVTWRPPANEGSPLETYKLQIFPGGEIRETSADQTTLLWDGLENGKAYSFRVMTENQTYPSEWSVESAFETPAGPPLNVPPPSDPQGGDQIVTVSWSEPNTNGAPIEQYELEVYRDGALAGTVQINDPNARSHVLTGAANGSSYTFRVRARNKAGWSDFGGQSNAAIPSGKPLQVASLTAAPTGTSGQVQLAFPDAGANGSAITGYQVSIGGGGWQALAANRLVGGLPNGVDHSFRVIGCNANGCSDHLPSPAAGANPFGPPSAPGISASVSGTVITWNWTVGDLGGRPLSRYEVYIDGAHVATQANTNYSRDFGGYSQGHAITVRVFNSEGLSAENSHSASTGPQPFATAVVVGGSTCPEPDLALPDSYEPGPPATCSSGWIGDGATLRVVCWTTGWKGWDNGALVDDDKWWRVTDGRYVWNYSLSVSDPKPGHC